MIVSARGFLIMLSVSGIFEIVSGLVEYNNANIDIDKSDKSLVEAYPILVPPNMIIQICLKDTLLLERLLASVNDCDSYPCMFSKIIEDESMEFVSSVIRNDTMGNANEEFRQAVQDCAMWWKLFKRFNKNANSRYELGKCLFQTVSTKCREAVLDKIRSLLHPIKER